MTTEKKIYDLHHEHQEWLSKLSFYKDDLAVMQMRVEEVASKNTSKEYLALVDHYSNQFLIQNGQISQLKHEIKNHEAIIESSVISNATAADHRSMPDHVEQREKMERFEVIFAELREDFNTFLAKVL